jgi:hypothetical protein
VAVDVRCDLAEVALFLVVTSGSVLSSANPDTRDLLLLDPVVLVAEFVELTLRKPITTTTTTQTDFILRQVIKKRLLEPWLTLNKCGFLHKILF